MADRIPNSRIFRHLAKELFQNFVAEGKIPEAEAGDFITSLVRQWITYEGNATWFFGEEQLHFAHRHTPLGKSLLTTMRIEPGCFASWQEKWKISPDKFPAIIEQLNRGQSAETANREGVPIRLWVNPKDGNYGAEVLGEQPGVPKRTHFFRQIAGKELLKNLDVAVDKEELEALACSVAMQWEKFQGHACIFLDKGQQFVLTIKEEGKGSFVVVADKQGGSLDSLLSPLGFSPASIAELTPHINLAQVIEFQNKEGVLTQFRYNPKEKRIEFRPKE